LATGSSNSSTTTHQVSLSNGSLVLVQQQQPQQQSQQLAQALQHSGITIQPATIQQQQQQVKGTTVVGANSALRAQLNSNVPILVNIKLFIASLKLKGIISSNSKRS